MGDVVGRRIVLDGVVFYDSDACNEMKRLAANQALESIAVFADMWADSNWEAFNDQARVARRMADKAREMLVPA